MPALPSSRPFAAWLVRAVAVALVAGLAWQVPLVRFRRLDEVAAAEVFDAKAFAERFWAADLEPACGGANDVADVRDAVRRDPATACQTLGRSPGLSRTCLYLVRGSGTIAEVGPTACRVALAGGPGAVELATGLEVGAAIREKFARRVGGGGGAADPKAISYAGHREQLRDFVRAVQTGSAPKVDGEEGRKSVEIILAIYKAAESGRSVQLPLKGDPRFSDHVAAR